MSGLIGDAGSRSGIVGLVPESEHYYTNSFLNSWVAWDLTNPPSDEHGMNIHRLGRVYIIQLAIYKASVSLSTSIASQIRTLTSSDMKLPSQNVNLGLGGWGNAGDNDAVSRLMFDTSGNVTVYGVNYTGSTLHVVGNFIGIDHG